jgi:hypothetical protein
VYNCTIEEPKEQKGHIRDLKKRWEAPELLGLPMLDDPVDWLPIH